MSKSRSLSAHGNSFAAALESMLNQSAKLLGSDNGPQTGDQSARLHAEGETRPILASRMIDALAAAQLDLDARIVDVVIDGVRAVDGGFRVWATAAVVPAAGQASRSLTVVGVPVVSELPDGCTIEVELRVD